jgi:hypothetical protein
MGGDPQTPRRGRRFGLRREPSGCCCVQLRPLGGADVDGSTSNGEAANCGATFIDARSRDSLYDDIYTGLLDRVEQRALCAQNLALAYRFDDAITKDPSKKDPESALDLLKAMLGPILRSIEAAGRSAFDWAFSSSSLRLNPTQRLQVENRAEERRKARDRKADAKARAYVHPKTYNIYSATYPVDAGCFLFPLQVISNDDSNLVRWQLVPNLLAAAMFAALRGGSGSVAQSVQGDGTVDEISANPPTAQLSTAFKHSSSVSALHLAMPGDTHVTTFIETELNDIVSHWDS